VEVENKRMKISALLIAVLVFSFAGLHFYIGNNEKRNSMVTDAGQTFSLVNPVFAESASSEATFLDEEAGMSIYVNIGQSIDLNVVRNKYRTIERETSNYTVGSVGLPGLTENEDVHCFVHKDGWIVIYYLKGELISKIVDWNLWSEDDRTLAKNKLQVGLEQMTTPLGVVVTGTQYYHFQYPNATECMVILDTVVGSGEDSFNITIPNDLEVYERSWSHYAQDTTYYYGENPSYFKIDGDTINSVSDQQDPVTNLGTLTVGDLIPDTAHVVSVSGERGSALFGVGIALAYQEP
jgi:hypothetical protein